jgi:hypothetical protein
MADTQNSQFTNLAFGNELLHSLVIPGIAQVEVDSGNFVILLD